MSKDQLKVTIEAPQGCGKSTLGNVIESFIRANWPAKSIARFTEINYDPKLVHSNCDILIIEKQTQ